MCGILGSINVPFDIFHLNEIKHRGPDDYGMECFKIGLHDIQLAHRRLSILDLSEAGHQPMFTHCGQYALIFNGEIYNHLELREKLPGNIPFRGHSDTESILYYLKEFGIEKVSDFNGIFAFAFLDLKQSKLFLARDPFGVKPLYLFSGDPGRLLFSSELRTIQMIAGPRPLNDDSLGILLRLRYNPAPDTLHQGIEKIRAGHYRSIDLQSDPFCMEKHFYGEGVPATHLYESGDGSLSRRYGHILEAAVQRQLLADVEIGILLSGGIDSAVVAAIAQKHSNNQLKAFTIGFDGEHTEDEIENAQKTAEFLGLEHHCRRISFHDFLSTIKQCTKIVEEPLATTSMIPMLYLAQLAAQHVKVVLTGQGADEPLGGYKRYKAELIRSKIPKGFIKLVPPLSRFSSGFNKNIQRGLKSIIIQDDIERFLSIYEVFTPKEILQLTGKKEEKAIERIRNVYNTLSCRQQKEPVERMMSLDSRLNLADDLLNYTDKITMHFSMECRVPFLDLELVRFIESLPRNKKLNIRSGKLIHKQFARELLPDQIIHRKKMSFQSPTEKWFRQQSHDLEEILLTKNTYFAEVFHQDNVSKILSKHKKGENQEKEIFLLLSIFYWMESMTEPESVSQPVSKIK